jgi:hypothetical protein
MRSLRLVCLTITAFSLTGCLSPVRRPVVELNPKPYLVHFPGIGGEAWFHRSFVRALHTGGFDAEGDVMDWTNNRFPIRALQAREDNQETAKRFAVDLTKRARAGQPIYVTSESGGAAIAVWVLENLPDDVNVEALVMLGPALSKEYDLSRALKHVRGSAYAFTSPYDKWVLSLGTSIFGTMDGLREPAAGCVGFVTPPGAEEAQYAKLVQRRYEAKWFWDYGRHGGHLDVLSVRFASGYIAPLLIETARRHGAETL